MGGAAVVCVAGPDRGRRRAADGVFIRQAQPLVVRVQQHERWDTHDAQLAETRIGADANGDDIIIPMRHYALTHTSVGDLADQARGHRRRRGGGAAVDARRGWREPRDPNICRHSASLLAETAKPQAFLSSGPSLRAARMALTRSSVASSSCGYLWPP